MLSKISTAQLCGFLFLFILLTSAASQALAGGLLDSADITGTMSRMTSSGRKFRLSIILDLISHVSIIALAAMLFVTFSPFNRSLALLGTLWRVVEGTILAFSEINNLLLFDLSQRSDSAAGSQSVLFESIGRMLMSAEHWGMKIGLLFLVLGSLMYAILFVTSGTIPLALGWFGVIASILAGAAILLNMINPNLSMASFLILIPYEIVLGFWLLIWGGQIGQP